MHYYCTFVWVLTLFLSHHTLAQKIEMNDSLVVIRHGDLPIILSAPHGGRISPPDVPQRDGAGISQFATVRDGNTDRLAFEVADYLQLELGKDVFLVVAQIDRACVDMNRPADESYEVGKAKRYYDAYHNALRTACDEVRATWGRGILLDLHGQNANRSAIYRGTHDGITVFNLVEQFGQEALVGENSICGQLEQKGLDIQPACDTDDLEHPNFSGGYIVQTYGSHQGTAIDAMQLEFGLKFRSDENLHRTAIQLASAIATFAKTYLPNATVQERSSQR